MKNLRLFRFALPVVLALAGTVQAAPAASAPPAAPAAAVSPPAPANPTWGKAAENKIYAQRLVERMVAANPDLGDLGLHAIRPGTKDYVIIAQTMDKIGKPSSEADVGVIQKDATLIYPFMIGDSPRYSSLIALRDCTGTIIGMAVFSFKRGPGIDKLTVNTRTVTLAAELSREIPSQLALFNPAL